MPNLVAIIRFVGLYYIIWRIMRSPVEKCLNRFKIFTIFFTINYNKLIKKLNNIPRC